MKKAIYLLLAVVLGGCADFTDIQPKGKNLLSTAQDLDMLLNYDYQNFSGPSTVTVTGAIFPSLTKMKTLRDEPIKTTNYALAFWDESVDRIALAESDGTYQEIYKIIGTICNPAISRADNVSGDRILANRIKAEAYVLRAWFHYLAVNIYAKAYDPATAQTDPGIAYLTEKDLADMAAPCLKYTVGEVYQFILDDLKTALDLNSLPEEGVTAQRVGQSFAYAVQAKVLMSMRNYGEALTAARKSLAINNHIDDHNDMLVQMKSRFEGFPDPVIFQRPQFSSKEELFETFTGLLFRAFTQEMLDTFDPNAVLLRHMPTYENIGANFAGVDQGLSFYEIPGLTVWSSNYNESSVSGAGLTTVDMYLTEAECLMRDGKLAEAMQVLENIRRHRIVAADYAPLTVTAKAEVFGVLKQLSRSENFFTFKDFIDLKRWNTEPEYAATLHKTLLDKEYSLSPDSDLWIFPFPQSATRFNDNLTQNF